jgi:transcriptional regulator with XRE-family HTH domain
MSKLGAAIKQWRDQQNISLRGLEERTGISHSTLNKIELGKRRPNLEHLTIIADTIGLPRWKAMEMAGYPSDFNEDDLGTAIASLARKDAGFAQLLDLLRQASDDARKAVLSYLLIRMQEEGDQENRSEK